MAKFESMDAYIASFPPDVQVKLESVRQVELVGKVAALLADQRAGSIG